MVFPMLRPASTLLYTTAPAGGKFYFFFYENDESMNPTPNMAWKDIVTNYA